MGALRRAGGDPGFVQARHEENAAFMAVGHAKYAGGVGVVTSTQGPGAVHLLNGLYDAKLDSVPVVAIMGQQDTTVLGAQYQQEIDLQTLVKDVAAQFVPDRDVRRAGADADRPGLPHGPGDPLALRRGPAARRAAAAGARRAGAGARGHGRRRRAGARRASCPHDEDLARGGRGAQRRPSGSPCWWARARAAPGTRWSRSPSGWARASRTSLLGKPYVDESLPFAAGVMGHLGTTASAHLMGTCDTLLMVGTNDPWTEFYPAPGPGAGVQIDIDGRQLGNRYPIEVGLTGDAAETLRALLPMLEPRADSRVAGRGRGAGARLARHRRHARGHARATRSTRELRGPRAGRPAARRRAGRVDVGLGRLLVRPPPAPAAAGAGAPVQHAGVDGLGAALRAGREAGAPRPAGGGARR